MDVVDDLLADVDGGAVVLERLLDGLDRALDAGAVAAGRGEENPFDHADRVSVAPSRARQRAVSASKIPMSTTTPPAIWTATSASPSQTQAITAAATGSKVATIPTVVAGRCLSAATESEKGTIVPNTIPHSASAATGTVKRPCGSSTLIRSVSVGKLHQGSKIAQASEAKPSPKQTTESGSRRTTRRSPIR